MEETETPVFRKTYDVSILKKIRDEIIDVLKKGNYKLTTTYNLSGAHPDSLRFVISSLSKGQEGIARSLLQMRKCLTKGFDNLVTTSEVASATDKFSVDVEQLYDAKELLKNAANGVGGDASENGNNGKLKKEEKRLGRQTSEFGIFRDTMVAFIEAETSARLNVKTIGFYITVEQSKPKKILLHCASSHVAETIVQKLELNPLYEPKIFKVVKDVIYISEQDVTVNTERKVAVEFFKKLENEILDKGFKALISSSATIAIASDPVEIKIQCTNAGEAASLASELVPNWKPMKNGVMVTLSLTKLIWKHALVQEGSYINTTHTRGLVVKPLSDVAAVVGSYVHSNKNYRDFEFLSFNRKRKKRHTNEIKKSMERWGVLSFVTVAITDCIDGVMRMWIVDGQHRFDAMEQLGNPILYTIANVHSKKEMVRLIAALNRTSKNWALRDYLHSWCSLDIYEYKLIQSTLERTKLPITLILEVFSGLDRRLVTEKFQAGEFEFADEAKAERYLEYIMELKMLMPRSRAILSCLLPLFNQYEEKYDNNKMKDMIKATKAKITKLPFTADDTAEITLKTLRKIYEGEYIKKNW